MLYSCLKLLELNQLGILDHIVVYKHMMYLKAILQSHFQHNRILCKNLVNLELYNSSILNYIFYIR